MIERQLKRKNFVDIDILPRQLQNIEARKKWDIEAFGKKVRISKFPKGVDTKRKQEIDIFKKSMQAIISQLKANKTENFGDVKKLISNLGNVFQKKRIEFADEFEVKKTFEALKHSGFPSKWTDFPEITDLTKNIKNSAFLKESRGEVTKVFGFLQALALKNVFVKTELLKTFGTLSLMRPIWWWDVIHNRFVPGSWKQFAGITPDEDYYPHFRALVPADLAISVNGVPYDTAIESEESEGEEGEGEEGEGEADK